MTCFYYTRVDSENREALLDFNDEVKRKQLACESLRSSECIYEKQLLNLLSTWTESYDPIELTDQGIKYFLVGVINEANSIPLEADLYDSIYLSLTGDKIFYKKVGSEFSIGDLSSILNSNILLSSSKLSIVGQVDYDSGGNGVFSQVVLNVNDGNDETIEFIFDDSASVNFLNKYFIIFVYKRRYRLK